MSLDGHTLDEDGEHDEEGCYQCLLGQEIKNDCRCGECCRRLIIEADVEDAKREPRIAQEGSPIYDDPRLTASGQRELIGYLLNAERNGHACVFFERPTNLCAIYATRPLLCRLFDCAGEGREQLVQLGILTREG
jgi:Fe-S-cluster containining protein